MVVFFFFWMVKFPGLKTFNSLVLPKLRCLWRSFLEEKLWQPKDRKMGLEIPRLSVYIAFRPLGLLKNTANHILTDFHITIKTLEVVARRCSVKKLFFEISQNSQESWGLQLYEKRDSGTGVFLWIFRNF